MQRNGVVIAAALALAVGAIAYTVMRTDTPQGTAAEDGAGPPMVEVKLPAEFSAAAQAGQAAFAANCAGCHGLNAAGQDGMGPPLVHIYYEPSHHADEAIHRAVALGVRAHHWRFGDMPPVEGLDRAGVADIVTYIRELQRENGIF